MSRRILSTVVFCVFLIVPSLAQTNFNRYNFNVGGGFAIGRGDVDKFTGTSFNGVAGGGWNFNRFLGVKAEYMYYNLGFNDGVKRDQGLQGADGSLQSLTLNGVANFRLPGRWGVYGIGGFGIYRRAVSAPSTFLAAGTVCQPAWIWWSIKCDNFGLVSPDQTLSSHTSYAGGYNFGGGLTYRLPVLHHASVFAEGRYHHSYTGASETSVFPVTFGLRW